MQDLCRVLVYGGGGRGEGRVVMGREGGGIDLHVSTKY